jgi:phosphoribosylamine--glycine ligase
MPFGQSVPTSPRLRLVHVRVLVVGSGGREHALAWKLTSSGAEVHAAPGNPGIARLGLCHPVRADDAEGLLSLAHSLGIDLVVVGPEAPLVAGVADRLRRGGIAVFGPSAAAARVEGSKSFAKQVMLSAGVPTAATMPVARPPCVVKVDGLAAGKGVFLCRTRDELDAGLAAANALRGPYLIEELLVGEELSVFALCDGSRALPLAAARDYKRIGDGDVGPNTGGMGSYSPVEGFDPSRVATLVAEIHEPVLAELAARGTPFTGVLYAGLILAEDGVRVLEFNCRFGDPEAQTILPRLGGDFLGALAAAAAGDLKLTPLASSELAAVTVVVAGGQYPEAGDSGSPIFGVDDAEASGTLVFQSGTALRGETLVTNGGRILSVTAAAEMLRDARRRAYAGVEKISFAGMRFRTDIAADA